MIRVAAKMTMKENTEETLKDLAAKLVAETRKEEGCISYQLCRDVKNKNVYIMFEEWATSEALQRHMNSKHFKEIIPQINALQTKDSDVNVCTPVV